MTYVVTSENVGRDAVMSLNLVGSAIRPTLLVNDHQ